MSRRAAAVVAQAALIAASALGSAPAALASGTGPQVVIFGGGSDPASTPHSVEEHVLALSQALARTRPRVLFAGGRPEQRTVQTLDTAPDRAGDWLARVLGPDGHVGVAYRAPRPRGPAASEAEILAAITAAARHKPGAIVFGAGHGLPAHEDEPAALALWGADRLTARELAGALDAPPARGPVALVLGQCHSGAFTDVAHRGGDPTAPLAKPTRCALAAVPDDRTASGCTPDAADPGARAYLALIAEALAPPAGKAAPRADYDRDGRVSLAEAHAYATLFDETIDLPVKSSEAWVRAALGEEAEKLHELPTARVLQLARPEVRAVLEGLRKPGSDAAGARAELDALDDRLDALDGELTPLATQRDEAVARLRLELLSRWPELSSPYHRVARSLLSARSDEILRAIEASPETAAVLALDARIGALEGTYDEVERQAVKLERWLRAYDTVALEAAIAKRGTPAQVVELKALIACEALIP